MIFYNFDQVGKGIDPNAPKKEGIALFFDILYREFWSILWLNLFFFVFSLPLFTIGASYSAVCAVMVKMVRDVPIDPFYEFRTAFNENFKQSTAVFFLQIAVIIILMINYQFYNMVNPYIHVVIGVIAVIFCFMNLYVVPLLVSVELPLKNILKNSFLLVFLDLKHSLLCALLTGLNLFVILFYFPYSFIYFTVVGFIFPTFITCFLTHYGIKKYCYIKEGEELEEEIPVSKPLTHTEEMELLQQELDSLQQEMEEEEEED